jgi:cell division protein FtsN
MRTNQRGGFVVGLIVGLLIGLALALAAALYVTKVPVPFVNKVPQRTAEQDAAEAERNKNWDPNAPLGSKSIPRAASAPPAAPPPAPAPIAAPAPARLGAPVSNATPPRDPAAILAGKPVPAPPAAAASVGVSAKYSTDPFTYFVQAGAYARAEEAEQQRAKLAMLGFTAKVTEREQSGRTMYRVRLGPYERKDEADQSKERLAGHGFEAALVRVQK